MDERTVECIDLADFDDAFAEADCEPAGDTDLLPDGRYRVVVEKVDLEVSQANNKMLVWQMRVLGPRYAGRKLWHRNMIVSKNNIRWLKRALLTAGLDLAMLSDLPNRLAELADVMLEIQFKTKGGSQNSFINKKVTGGQGGHTEPAVLSGDSDFPF